jgi:aquaporin Z
MSDKGAGLRTIFLSELIGTAVLVAVGLSFVIIDFGSGGPVSRLIPGDGWRRLLTGFLFGTTGGLIAVSPVGKHSGAHINPVVSAAFRLKKKISSTHLAVYVAAQLMGAVLGALPLLAWGGLGRSVDFGASLPGRGVSLRFAFLGEAVTTFFLVAGLFFFLGRRRLRRFTPLLFPFLYAVMVFLEARVSGTSTNPARSLGPQVVSGVWRDWWIYWLGPAVGMLAGILVHRLPGLRRFEAEVAKIYHFEHDPFRIFRGGGPAAPPPGPDGTRTDPPDSNRS